MSLSASQPCEVVNSRYGGVKKLGSPRAPPLHLESTRPPLPSRPSDASRSATGSSVLLLYEIKRLLLDPRQPHNLVCSRKLRRIMQSLGDLLAYLDNDLNGTPISPTPIRPRTHWALLDGASVKLQRTLDSLRLYQVSLRYTPIRKLWRKVYAQSGQLDIVIEMLGGLAFDLNQVCYNSSKLVVKGPLSLDTTMKLGFSPRQRSSPQSSLFNSRRSVPRVSSPLAEPWSKGAVLSPGVICETPDAMYPPSFKSPIYHTHNRSSSSLNSMNLLTTDKIIVVMGPTGAGKSTLINTALGRMGAKVSDQLDSCTHDIQAYRCSNPYNGEQDIVLVDTPGFDDTYRSDADILQSIADWLNSTYQRRILVSGILYLHRLSDNRFAGAPLRNLNVFNHLCGSNALKNVVLVTTMGDDLELSVKNQRLRELQDIYWHEMIGHGSRVHDFDLTSKMIWKIIDGIGIGLRQPEPLQLPKEMVDQGKSLFETKAGKTLFGCQAAAESQTSLALKTEKLKLEAQRVTVLQQREKLRTYPSPARRFTNMIKRKVGERVYRHRGRSAPHTKDTRLLPEQKARAITAAEDRFQAASSDEVPAALPDLRACFQIVPEILSSFKNSHISSNIIVKLLNDLITLLPAIVEKYNVYRKLDLDLLNILKHMKEELASVRDVIRKFSLDTTAINMDSNGYRLILSCKRTVKNIFNALEGIPWDVLKHILRRARIPDLLALISTCRQFYELASDVTIQYAIEAYLAGAKEITYDLVSGNVDALTRTSLPERLKLLRHLEEAWRSLSLPSWEKIDVSQGTSEFHGLSGGVLEVGEASYFGDGSTAAVNYALLPGLGFGPTSWTWKRLDVGGTICSTAISLYENDLIGAITRCRNPLPNDLDQVIIEIHLIQATTGLPHPFASRSLLTGPQLSSSNVHEVRSKILGDHITVVISSLGLSDDHDRFLVFNWDHTATSCSVYRGVAFLSESMVVITDTSGTPSLNLWHLLPNPRYIGSLLFPPLQFGLLYDMCDIQDEPCLYSKHSPTAPFYPAVRYNPEDAIMTILVFLGLDKTYFVASRRKLLETAERLYKLPPTDEPPQLEYKEWSAHAARWIPANELATDSPMRHGGQRLVAIREDAPEEGSKLIVYDFNPFHIHKWADELSDIDMVDERNFSSRESTSTSSHKPRLFLKKTPQEISENLPFSSPLEDELPYILYESEQTFNYGAVWTDGERVAGVTLSYSFLNMKIYAFAIALLSVIAAATPVHLRYNPPTHTQAVQDIIQTLSIDVMKADLSKLSNFHTSCITSPLLVRSPVNGYGNLSQKGL
ncbi:hypothetical protein ONZ45_g11263 [Pleurotus djamor]|nr:hypothetical protein ONZ45_g11263 [Pleurotus djamor]